MSGNIHLTTGKPVLITECNWGNDSFRKLYLIFRLTLCPGMSEATFEAYYKSKNLRYIDVSFYYAGETLAGFSAAAFYEEKSTHQPLIIGRSATGILPNYRGCGFNKWVLYSKYMRYKWQHPAERLILTIYASNPFIYSMVGKYTGILYPRPGRPVPLQVLELKEKILIGNGLQKREAQPFVVRIGFEVEKTGRLKAAAVASPNRYVRYFVEKTGLQPHHTLLVIIPVSFKNILMCMGLFVYHYLYGLFRQPHPGDNANGGRPPKNKGFHRFFIFRKITYAHNKGM